MSTDLQKYLAAKAAGNVSLGDESKPVHMLPTVDNNGNPRYGFVDVFAPSYTGTPDPDTLQPTAVTVKHGPYNSDRLRNETIPRLQEEKAQLETRLAEVNFDLDNMATFIADVDLVAETDPTLEEETS